METEPRASQGDVVDRSAGRALYTSVAYAAHCERVLMHVEDPERAVREMRRVVRPGGRVVVAEIFAQGATQDHPDVETNRQIVMAMVSGIRNGRIGIQLRGLLVEAGFADVDGEIVGLFEAELDQDEAEEYAQVARDLVAAGTLDRVRAEDAIAAMEDKRARGTHCGLAVMFVASGRVPEAVRD